MQNYTGALYFDPFSSNKLLERCYPVGQKRNEISVLRNKIFAAVHRLMRSIHKMFNVFSCGGDTIVLYRSESWIFERRCSTARLMKSWLRSHPPRRIFSLGTAAGTGFLFRQALFWQVLFRQVLFRQFPNPNPKRPCPQSVGLEYGGVAEIRSTCRNTNCLPFSLTSSRLVTSSR